MSNFIVKKEWFAFSCDTKIFSTKKFVNSFRRGNRHVLVLTYIPSVRHMKQVQKHCILKKSLSRFKIGEENNKNIQHLVLSLMAIYAVIEAVSAILPVQRFRITRFCQRAPVLLI